ncbi:hypothetical protein K438DRAFT_1935457 [Mycena galopus ATCC 62051]|nr:hypothetical protein K438DRAFT_1935457 [Mycena galopus ATCC 62051]
MSYFESNHPLVPRWLSASRFGELGNSRSHFTSTRSPMHFWPNICLAILLVRPVIGAGLLLTPVTRVGGTTVTEEQTIQARIDGCGGCSEPP